MPKPHIKPYDMRTVAGKDEVEISTQEGEVMLRVGKDGMRRVYCSEGETVLLIKALVTHGYKLWGEDFLCNLTTFMENR